MKKDPNKIEEYYYWIGVATGSIGAIIGSIFSQLLF